MSVHQNRGISQKGLTYVGAFASVGSEVCLEVVPLGIHLSASLDVAVELVPLCLVRVKDARGSNVSVAQRTWFFLPFFLSVRLSDRPTLASITLTTWSMAVLNR